jgi:hypothetical protein
MSQSRFVRPDTVTLPLSDGDTITIRKELNNGETRKLAEHGAIPGTSPPRMDPMRVGPALIAAYLLDWTLTDASGSRVEVLGLSREELLDTVDQLRTSDVTEIIAAISAHVSTHNAVAAEEKKLPSGASAS